jgi:hypothetical protein
LLFVEDAVGLCVFRACIFGKCNSEFEQVVHEGNGAAIADEGRVTIVKPIATWGYVDADNR